MNELFGMLIPLLLSGAGFGDILRALGGSGPGASRMDGLGAMTNDALFSARVRYPMVPGQHATQRVFENAAARLFGVNPYSAGGQGAAEFMRTMYGIFPDAVGGVLGIPNSNQFFSTIANGASGIGLASRQGATDIFNPYSVMESHRRAMDLSQVAHSLGTRPGGGYNISYSHGLNMGEMGLVTQRLLSSDMAYRDENGNRIDPEKNADKFKSNLKDLGSKFNEAASMLSKITGSVEEALTVMDRIAGGNFLGGSKEQATKVAERAKNMAAAIRVTAAMAGTDPSVAYANIRNLTGGMTQSMGITNPMAAAASGMTGMMGDLAYAATMGYNMWAAANPQATQAQKEAAMFAVNSSVQSYMQVNGQAFSSLIADNAGKFSKDQLARITNAIRRGDPNSVLDEVRSTVGEQLYDAHMNDKAMQVAARHRAFAQNGDLMRTLDSAALEGGIKQAEAEGTSRMIGLYVSDLDSKIENATGKGNSWSIREEMVKKALSGTVKKVLGLSEEDTKDWSLAEVRDALERAGGYDEQEEQRATLSAAESQIIDIRMSDEEDADARRRLALKIGLSDNAKTQEWQDRLSKNGSLDSVIKEFSATIRDQSEAAGLYKEIYGDRMSQEQADSELYNIRRAQRSVNGEYTADERMNEIERRYKESRVKGSGRLLGAVTSADYDDMMGAMAKFSREAVNLERDGVINLDGKGVSEGYEEAAKRVVSEVIGSNLGPLEGKDLEDLKKNAANEMLNIMRFNKNVTVEDALGKALFDQRGNDKLGKSGKDAIDFIIGKVRDKDTSIGKAATGEAFFSHVKSVIEESGTPKTMADLDEMRKLSNGDFGKLAGKDAFNRFVDLMEKTGQSGLKPEDLEKLREEGNAAIAKDENEAKEQIANVLSKAAPKGLNGGQFAAFAGLGANSAAELLAAMQYRAAGGKLQDSGMFSKEVVDAVSRLDDIKATGMNAVSNAWGVGGNDYARNAIAGVEKQMEELGGLLSEKKISADTLKKYYEGDKGAKEKIEGIIGGRATSVSDAALLKSIGGGAKIGGRSAADVLLGGKSALETTKKGTKEDKYNEDMLDIARKTGRNENGSYEMIHQLGDFVQKIAPFFMDPAQGIKVYLAKGGMLSP